MLAEVIFKRSAHTVLQTSPPVEIGDTNALIVALVRQPRIRLLEVLDVGAGGGTTATMPFYLGANVRFVDLSPINGVAYEVWNGAAWVEHGRWTEPP